MRREGRGAEEGGRTRDDSGRCADAGWLRAKTQDSRQNREDRSQKTRSLVVSQGGKLFGDNVSIDYCCGHSGYRKSATGMEQSGGRVE